jgi:hypothetical protein
MPKAEEIFNGHNFGCHSAGNLLYQIFCQCSIPVNAQNIRIERTPETCGQLNDFYKIALDTTAEPEKPVFEKVETEPGKVNIIQYSEKAIAVIGDTKPIKDTLKSLGGSFNFRLTCGPGWIFPASKLEAIKTALNPKKELHEEIKKTVEFFQCTDIQLYGQVSEHTKHIMNIQNCN